MSTEQQPQDGGTPEKGALNIGSMDDMRGKIGLEPEKPQEPAEQPKNEPANEPQEQNPENQPQEPEKPAEPAAPEKPSDPAAPTEPEKPAEPEKTIFDINAINKELSTDFKDKDSLLKALNSSEGVEELKGVKEELEKLKEENLVLKENFDPMKFFASEDDYKAAQFKKQFPDKDPSVAYKLISTDLTKMEDRDVIAHNLLMDNPDLEGGLKGAYEIIDEKYGIEAGEEIDSLTKNKMKVDARSARQNIDTVKSEIKLPEQFDASKLTSQQKELQEQKTAKLKEGWGAVANEISNTLPDIVVTEQDSDGKDVEVFRYSIKNEVSSEEINKIVDTLAQSGVEVGKEAASMIQASMRQKYLDEHISDIISASRKDTLAKAEEDRLKKQHNPGTPAPEAKPPEEPKSDQDKLLNDLQTGNGASRIKFF
jgi:hypothetical protein